MVRVARRLALAAMAFYSHGKIAAFYSHGNLFLFLLQQEVTKPAPPPGIRLAQPQLEAVAWLGRLTA